ncbi:MAG: hypothetical protein ACR2RV_27610 [Verrucomicrobiales bacterium]
MLIKHIAAALAFIAQFDSGLPSPDKGEFLSGSGGMCDNFWCDACAVLRESEAVHPGGSRW